MRIPSVERGCNGKTNLGRRFAKQADRLAKKHGKRFAVYACPHCEGYHATTKVQNADIYGGILYDTGKER